VSEKKKKKFPFLGLISRSVIIYTRDYLMAGWLRDIGSPLDLFSFSFSFFLSFFFFLFLFLFLCHFLLFFE